MCIYVFFVFYVSVSCLINVSIKIHIYLFPTVSIFVVFCVSVSYLITILPHIPSKTSVGKLYIFNTLWATCNLPASYAKQWREFITWWQYIHILFSR